MKVELPDGSVLDNVPEGTTKQQIVEKLRAAGNRNWESMARSASWETPMAFLDHAISEPLTSLFTGAVATPVAGIAGLGAGLMGEENPGDVVEKVQNALTYQPKTSEGKAVLKGITYPLRKLAEGADYAGKKAATVTGSPTVGAAVNTGIQSLPALFLKGRAAPVAATSQAAEEAAAQSARATARAAHYVENNTTLKWNQLSQSAKAMMTSIAKDAEDLQHLEPKAVERVLRGASLPYPVRMTRGQATRDVGQITREENIRKSDAGQELRNIQNEQDEALFRNLDVLRNEAGRGSKVGSSTDVGKSVQTSLRRKLQVLEGKVTRAYAEARKSGETVAPVDISPLMEWLKNPTNKRNAGFVESAVKDYSKDGKVTINDLEEIRKEAVANAMGPRSPASHFAGEAVGVIDRMLDQAGGDAYKAARAAHRAVKEEFERQGAIKKLTGEKGKTNDRATALEDTLEQVVVRGSNEDLAKVKKTLLEGGTEQTQRRGAQAWRDLQAGALDYLREKAGGKRRVQNERGGEQFNSSFLDALYDLDRDGKLSTLFGEHVAEHIRMLSKTVADVRTTPGGRISGSDSVPRILNILEKASHVPIVGKVASGAARVGIKLHEMGKETQEAAQAARTPLDESARTAQTRAHQSGTRDRLGPNARFAGTDALGRASDQQD